MARDAAAAAGNIRLPVERLHVELTNRCNFACEFCPDGRMRRPRGQMPPSMVEEILDQAGRDRIARQVHFHVMGEPLLYPDLARAVARARRRGMEAWVTTNGSLLSREVLHDLAAADLTRLVVSVQTPDAATFALRGAGSLSFDEYRRRVVDAVRLFLEPGGTMCLTLVFFANPLHRYFAPDAPRERVGESCRELRGHMESWVRAAFGGTAREDGIPKILARTGRAGILKEGAIPVSERVEFRVRILGNWAGHFDRKITPARLGFCPGLSENFGILANGDYVICCTDFDGKTVLANFARTPLREYLALPEVREIARGFRRYRVVHPHCRQCLGDAHPLHSLLRQLGSIAYFKGYRKLFPAIRESRAAS